MRTLVMVVCAAVAAGCLQVDVGNGALKCSSNPNRLCPEGYFCAANDTCWKNGSTPPFSGKHQGEACGPGDICDTGHCVDGVCCDSACSGQCQACNVVGVCTTISGTPRGLRPPCPTAGFDPCAAVCDGQNAAACTYPGASTPCGGQLCIGPPPTLKSATVCDGAGRCIPPSGTLTTPCPAPPNGTATCSGNQCDFTCNPPYQRVGSMCMMAAGDMG